VKLRLGDIYIKFWVWWRCWWLAGATYAKFSTQVIVNLHKSYLWNSFIC